MCVAPVYIGCCSSSSSIYAWRCIYTTATAFDLRLLLHLHLRALNGKIAFISFRFCAGIGIMKIEKLNDNILRSTFILSHNNDVIIYTPRSICVSQARASALEIWKAHKPGSLSLSLVVSNDLYIYLRSRIHRSTICYTHSYHPIGISIPGESKKSAFNQKIH